jgi:hypothetical protein
MAGAGYRNFTAGAVLTAAQVNTFLMEQSVMNFAGTAARGSALASVLSAGQMAHVGGGTVTVYDGSAWQQVYPGSVANSWTAYTPALTAATTNPTLGTGSTTTGAYVQIGKFVIANFRIGFGSSGAAAGSGSYRVSLPVAGNTAHNSKIAGTLYFGDNSANVVRLGSSLFWISSTTVSLRIDSTSAALYEVTNSNPWTWANDDAISGMFFYEAA